MHRFCMILALFLCQTIAADSLSQAEKAYEVVEDKASVPLLTPSMQGRKTAKLRLKNGLEAYIISDPLAEKSAAALIVGVGSWQEPPEHPGLAHFLEHMLFLGTAKYPIENDYDRFISLHGGISNAFTSNDATAYMFSVDHQSLEGALDRFSSFFIEPLFAPSGVARELNAIDQEFAKNLEEDSIRQNHVLKVLSQPTHPQSRFHMGNSATLAATTPTDLKQWYESHYSSDIMHLFLYSALPLETLKDYAVAKFSAIPRRDLAIDDSVHPITADETSGKIIFIEPVKNARTMTLTWELNPHMDTESSHPEKLICFVLGHEGPTSLVAQLKREGLATALSCGVHEYSRRQQELAIEIELTAEGLHKHTQVIERVYQALAGLKAAGISKELFLEAAREELTTYQYSDRLPAFEEAMNQALNLDHEPLETYPEKRELLGTYDSAKIAMMLRELSPQKMRATIMAPRRESHIAAKDIEPFLKVAYAVRPVAKHAFKLWNEASPHPAIILPEPNPFIAENFSLLKPREKTAQPPPNRGIPVPEHVRDDSRCSLFYAGDTLYGLPQAAFRFTIKTPMVTAESPANMAMAELYIKCLKEVLAGPLYDGELAGLSCRLHAGGEGVEVAVWGFNDKLATFLETIAKALPYPECDQEGFLRFKDALLREYNDEKLGSPLIQAVDAMKNALYQHYATAQEKERHLRKATFADFLTYLDGLYKENFIEAMAYGNITEQQSLEATELLLQSVEGDVYPKDKQFKKRILLLPFDKGPFFLEENIAAGGNAIILAIEGGEATYAKRAAQQVAMPPLREAFFNALRTLQQTGYLIFSQGEELEGQLVNLLALQSNSHDVRDLLARFELFLEGFLRSLPAEVTAEHFETLKLALLSQLEQPPHNLVEMSAILQQLAFTYDGAFDRPTKRIEALKELSYDTFLQETRQVLGRDNRRRLALLLHGKFPDKGPLRYEKARSRSWLKSTTAQWTQLTPTSK